MIFIFKHKLKYFKSDQKVWGKEVFGAGDLRIEAFFEDVRHIDSKEGDKTFK